MTLHPQELALAGVENIAFDALEPSMLLALATYEGDLEVATSAISELSGRAGAAAMTMEAVRHLIASSWADRHLKAAALDAAFRVDPSAAAEVASGLLRTTQDLVLVDAMIHGVVGADFESDVERLLADLESPQPKDRVYALRCLAEFPLADTRVLAAAETLLADETLTVLSIPYTFGEVRWVAAAAVAALRGALQRSDDVVLNDVPTPLTPDMLGALTESVGLSAVSGGIEGSLDAVARLRALGRLPRRNVVRMP